MPDTTYTQEDRLLSIDTPLGPDVLLLQAISGSEGISRLFCYELDLLAYDNDSIDFESIIGQKVSITIQLPDGSPRYINGYVSRFTQGDTDERLFTHYHAQVVPWLWFLTRSSDCAIFQNETVDEIISDNLQQYSVADLRMNLQGTYPTLEYCVQYRETMFNFISRLMEEYGIFYYFDHTTQGQHTMVVTDQSNALADCPSSPLSFDTQVGGLDDPEVVHVWNIAEEVRTAAYTLTDYNFTIPSTSLLATQETVLDQTNNEELELYDYPGRYTTKDEGDTATKIRMQEEETPHQQISAASNCRGLMSGYAFDLQNHYRDDQNVSYVVTAVRHFASAGDSYTAEGEGTESYSNEFTCIPASVPFRPVRVTPKPFVQGPQPALVVGKAGEEIWVDNYGRVKVQFYWDRYGQRDENSSCWIRVSQPWAGAGWGGIWIPRIGQEVIVSFLEGDPDRPIITGRVYNAEQMPPYQLPDKQTVSTFQSRSSKDGGNSNFNELRFEDKKGSEQVFLNAEKEMDLRVEHNSREFVGANRSLIVGGNQLELVQAAKHLHVKGDQVEKIDGDMSLQIGGDQKEKTTGDQSIEVQGDQKHKVTGDVSLQIGGDQKEKVGGDVSLDVTGSRNEKIGDTHAMEATQTIHLKSGMTVVIEAGMQLSLKGPGGFVDIGPAGVTIQGTMVLINSGGAAASGPGASPDSPDDPDAPDDPNGPDTADDGTKFGKLNS